MKILSFADLHIGNKSYGHIDKESGLNSREVDSINILNEIVDYAVSNSVDVVVFPGDMYKNSSPSTTIVDKVNEAFARLSKNNIRTYVLDGNHDVSKMETFNSGLSQFTALNVPNIIQTRFFMIDNYTVDNEEYQFVFLPTHHTKEEIENIMDTLDTSKKTIVIGHLAIKNAQLNDWTIMDNEACIEPEVFNKKNILAVILGHFHKYQIINKEPFVYYCGSANRIDFSEGKQPKGFVLLDVNGSMVKHKFVELEHAQKFVTIRVDGKDETNTKIIEDKIKKEVSKTDINDAFLRIQIELDDNMIFDEKSIIQFAYDNGVQYVLKLQKIIPKKVVATNDTIDNTLTVTEALEYFYKGQKRESERIKLGKEIVEKVEEGA